MINGTFLDSSFDRKASFSDWVSSRGGLNLGEGPVSLVLTIIIVFFVGYLTITRKDVNQLVVQQQEKMLP